jgi:hypothetical protein
LVCPKLYIDVRTHLSQKRALAAKIPENGNLSFFLNVTKHKGCILALNILQRMAE